MFAFSFFLSTAAAYDKEEQVKFAYVYKGPQRARQKKVFYVFGKGLKVGEDGFVQSNYKPEEQSFQRPIFYKQHGHVYFDIIVLKEGMRVTFACFLSYRCYS